MRTALTLVGLICATAAISAPAASEHLWCGICDVPVGIFVSECSKNDAGCISMLALLMYLEERNAVCIAKGLTGEDAMNAFNKAISVAGAAARKGAATDPNATLISVVQPELEKRYKCK